MIESTNIENYNLSRPIAVETVKFEIDIPQDKKIHCLKIRGSDQFSGNFLNSLKQNGSLINTVQVLNNYSPETQKLIMNIPSLTSLDLLLVNDINSKSMMCWSKLVNLQIIVNIISSS